MRRSKGGELFIVSGLTRGAILPHVLTTLLRCGRVDTLIWAAKIGQRRAWLRVRGGEETREAGVSGSRSGAHGLRRIVERLTARSAVVHSHTELRHGVHDLVE